jgi:hypothetical protein
VKRNYTKFYSKYLKRKDHLGDEDADGMIVLILIFKKSGVRV